MKVKIGVYDYRIRAFKGVMADAESADGLCQPDTQSIYIDARKPPQYQAAVLIHELIHAIWASHNLKKTKLCEEDVCGFLDNPLAALLRDNPKLLAVLMDALSRDVPIV